MVEEPAAGQQSLPVHLPALFGQLGAGNVRLRARQLLLVEVMRLAGQGVVAIGAIPLLGGGQVELERQLPVPQFAAQSVTDQHVQLAQGASLLANGQVAGNALQPRAGIHQGGDPLLEDQPQAPWGGVAL